LVTARRASGLFFPVVESIRESWPPGPRAWPNDGRPPAARKQKTIGTVGAKEALPRSMMQIGLGPTRRPEFGTKVGFAMGHGSSKGSVVSDWAAGEEGGASERRLLDREARRG